MKKFASIFLTTILIGTSFAQLNDTSVVAKSVTIDLNYSPTTPVSKTTMTFLKFKDDYGIQFFFLTPNKYIPHIFIESIDSLVLGLTNDQKITLNRPYRDTIFKQIDGSHCWQITYFMNKPQFEELSREKISELFATHGSRPLTLRIKRKSQNKIIGVASSF